MPQRQRLEFGRAPERLGANVVVDEAMRVPYAGIDVGERRYAAIAASCCETKV